MDPVDEQLSAYNARDLERFLSCYADDVVIEDADGAALMEGIDALRRRYGALFENSPGLQARLIARMRVADHVIDEERVTGANLPGLPPELHAAVVYRVRAGRIVHVRMIR